MIEISNSDFKAVVRLLRVLVSTKGDSRRENEARRKASLLLKKLARRWKEAE